MALRQLRYQVRTLFKNRLFWIISLIVAVALVSGNVILVFEQAPDRQEFKSPADGIWWAVVTMTIFQ